MEQVHQWVENERTREFLRKEQGLERIPYYYWFLRLLKQVKPESLNRCLKKWAERLLPADRKAVSVALEGKTIRSTGKMNVPFPTLCSTAASILFLFRLFWLKIDFRGLELTVDDLTEDWTKLDKLVLVITINEQEAEHEYLVKAAGPKSTG